MDNKITKKRINDHLEYDWFKYLIILAIVIFGAYAIFDAIARDRDYEEMMVFATCYSYDETTSFYSIKEDMKEMDTDTYGGNYVRTLSLNTQNPLNSEYGTLLSTHGQVLSDILILGAKNVVGTEEYDPSLSYLELSDDVLKYIFPQAVEENGEFNEELLPDGIQFYYEKVSGRNTRRAIRVDTFKAFSGDDSIIELNWHNIPQYENDYGEKDEEAQPDSEFYLVINRDSANIGRFGKKSKKDNYQTFFVARRLIELYR